MSVTDTEVTTTNEKRTPGWVRVIDLISKVLVVPSAVVCVVLMLHVIADVVGRTLFNHPLPATLEIASFWWMVLLIFGGFGYAELRSEHVRATVLTDHVPPSWQKAAEIVALVSMGGLGLLIAYYGWFAAVGAAAIEKTVLSALPVPIWQVMFIVPVGGLALALQCVASIQRVLTTEGPLVHHEAELV